MQPYYIAEYGPDGRPMHTCRKHPTLLRNLAVAMIGIVLLAAGPATAGTANTQKKQETQAVAFNPKVVSNVQPTLINANVQVTMEKGYFKDEGLDVEIPVTFMNPTQFTQLLTGGKLDIAHTSPGPQDNNAILRGAPITIIGGGALIPPKGQPSGYLMVSDKLYQQGVKSIKDLKGHEINIFPGYAAGSGRSVTKLLEQVGLTKDDVKWRSWTDQSQMGQTFQTASIDVAYFLEPMGTIIKEKIKVHVLGTSSDVLAGDPVLVFYANSEWLKQNPETAIRFMKAILRGTLYYLEAKNSKFQKNADVVDILAKVNKVSPDIVRKAGLSDYSADGTVKVEALIEGMKFLQSAGAIESVAPWKQHTDLSYVQEAYKRLKGKGKP